MAQLRGSGSQHQLLPTHHSMPNWLSYPLAAGPARQVAGCSVISVLSGNLSFAWTLVSSLAVASCHRRCGGGMLLRTGSHGSGVECRVPVIVRIDVFN